MGLVLSFLNLLLALHIWLGPDSMNPHSMSYRYIHRPWLYTLSLEQLDNKSLRAESKVRYFKYWAVRITVVGVAITLVGNLVIVLG